MKKMKLLSILAILLLAAISFVACGLEENPTKTQIAIPTLNENSFVYDGTTHSVSVEENAAYTLGGDVTKTEVGNYTATVTLVDTAKYEWTDGTTEVINLNWSITVIELNFVMVYNMATELGFDGTLEELIEAFKGDSAYQVAVNNGYEGSESEWLETLIGAAGSKGDKGETGAKGDKGDKGDKGETGVAGETGENGKDGISPTIGENGNWYIGEIDTGVKAKGEDGADGKDGKDGVDGKDGEDGIDGESAFDIWKELHGDNDSTEEDFINWLKGKDGENGKDGADGKDGVDGIGGKSAFDIYKETYGYDGTEQEWIEDLINGTLAVPRFTVNFETNGAEQEIESQIIIRGDKVSKPSTPIKAGYTFEGWYISDQFLSEDYWEFLNYTVSCNITMYAKWLQNIYTITFDGNGGSNMPSNISITYGATMPPLSAMPIKANSSFLGFFDSNDVQYYDKDLNGIGTWDKISHTTLYAKWSDWTGEGEGTQENPYNITTKQQLALLSTKVSEGEKFTGKYFALRNDIDLENMEWMPIGIHESLYFNGEFDGNGYTISNYNISVNYNYAGLFGHSKGVVKNLNVTGFSVDISPSALTYIGGLVGYLEVESLSLNAINVQGGIIVANQSNDTYIGGVVGYIKGSIAISNSNISVGITISAQSVSYIGGLFGYVYSSISITNCDANGSINANVSAVHNSYVGGLAGLTFTAIIENFSTAGNINIASGSASQGSDFYSYLGGFIGKCENITIANSSSSSDIIGSLACALYVGGFVGIGSAEITNSSSSGLIDVATLRSIYAGGLAGYTTYSSVIKSYVTGSVNVGITSSTSRNSCVGGLFGYVSSSTLDSCYATGDISVNATIAVVYAGGLVGGGDSFGIISNCYAMGNVTVSSLSIAHAGGLIGYLSRLEIDSCYATGDVYSLASNTAYTGGLIGFINSFFSSSTITNSYSKGEVAAHGIDNSAYSGGFIGYIDSSSNYTTDIINCYSTANVSASTDSSYVSYAGGMIGYISYSVTISGSFATGNVSAKSGGVIAYVGGLIAYSEDSTQIGSYRYENQIYHREQLTGTFNTANGVASEICTQEMLSSVDFYTTTLGWDTNIWDFSDLDFENGKLPTLK